MAAGCRKCGGTEQIAVMIFKLVDKNAQNYFLT